MFPKLFIRKTLLLLFIITSCCSAQTKERNYIGGSFGGTDFYLKDVHSTPLIFNSVGIAPSIQYIYKGGRHRHYAEVSYYHGNLKTSSGNFWDQNHNGRIRYCYLHSITDFAILSKQIDFFLGGSIGTFLSHSDYLYNWVSPVEARAGESWYWSNSLDISALLEYNPEPREAFSIQLFIPVVSNVSRPKYSLSGDFNYIDNDWKFKIFGKTKLFPDNFSVNTLVSYTAPLFDNINYQINYEFYYSFYDEPRDINMFMNNLRAGFLVCF